MAVSGDTVLSVCCLHWTRASRGVVRTAQWRPSCTQCRPMAETGPAANTTWCRESVGFRVYESSDRPGVFSLCRL